MTTMTKTNPVKTAETALADATETLYERRKALQGNLARIEAIKNRWAVGDDSIPASEKIEAEAEVARLTTLVQASEKAVRAAERKLKALTPILAETVAWALGDAVHGVTAEAITGSAPVQPSSDVKVYVQEKGERRSTDTPGQVRGDVTITVTGPVFMAGFDKHDVDRALSAGGLLLDGTSRLPRKVRDGVFTYDLRVTATPTMPVIPFIHPDRYRGLGFVIQSFVRLTRNRAYGDETVSGTSKAEVVNTSINEDGIRRTVVEVSMHFRKTKDATQTLDQIGKQAEAFMSSYYPEGKGLHGIGSIEDVQVSVVDSPIEQETVQGKRMIPAKTATARMTVVSKVA